VDYDRTRKPPRISFTPENFLMLLEIERKGFVLYMCLVHGRERRLKYHDTALKALLESHVRWLRN
jgi:hypothetical protein